MDTYVFHYNNMHLMQKKYIIHEDGKKWVFSTISSVMRVWKCRLKAKHFKKHTRTSACLKDRPKTVPMEQWTKIVKKWSSEESKVLSNLFRMKISSIYFMNNFVTGL